MSVSQILANACVVFAGVIIGAVVAKFIDYKIHEQENLYHFYATFICVNSKGKRVYRTSKVSLRHLNPTEDEIKSICQDVLVINPEYKECAIMSWIRLGADSPVEKREEVSDEAESEEVE